MGYELSDREIQVRFALVRQQIQAGQMQGAIETLREVLGSDPDHADAHALLALVLHDSRRIHAAQYEAGLALTLDPEGYLPLRAVATVAIAQRRFAEAEDHVRRLLVLEPSAADAHRDLARIHDLTGRRKEALPWLQKALELEPEDPSALADLGQWYLDEGQVDEAEPWARRALEAQPEHQQALVLMGHILVHRDRLEEAREHAIWALQNDPGSRPALHLLVSIKTRRSLVLGLWWRYSTWMGALGEGRAILVLLSAFVLYRVGVITADHLEHQRLAEYLQFLWLALVAYTWIGPGLFLQSLKKELKTVRLNKEF